MQLLRQFSISQRLLVIALLVIVIIGGLVGRFATSYHANLLEARTVKTRHVVEAGLGVMAHFYSLEAANEVTREQAQEAAKTAIGNIRYGDDDYYWIQNRNIVMVHHPFSPHLDGKDLSKIEDPNGKRLFTVMEKTIAEHGHGTVTYEWPKPGFKQPVPKVSYVAEFQPWGWVLGSGIYLDDVREDFWKAMAPQLVVAAFGLIILAAFSWVIANSIVRPLKRAVRAMDDIATGEGDLTRRLNTDGSDELSQLADGFNRFTDKLAAVVRDLRQTVARNRQISDQVNKAMIDAKNSYDQQKKELENVAAAVEQMSVTAQDVSQRVSESAGAARDAGDRSRQGQARVQNTRDAMERLAKDIADSSRTMAELDQQSKNINSVLDVIRGVAEQTNLLALNAAIEAARAGEQGRGFAVVADEVRTLASRAQTSTDEIREIIGALNAGSAAAVIAMESSHNQSNIMSNQVEEVKSVLAGINDSVLTITDMTHHIASAAEQQSQTANSIAISLSQLSDLSDAVLVELNDTAGNTELLNEAGEDLDRLVGQFKI